MKKLLMKSAALLISALMLSTSVMAAANWTGDVTVEAGKGTASIDGKFDAAEWASAKEIAITLDDATVKQYGVYQGAWETERNADDFSASMYFMWDEEALYFCEVRKDNAVDLNGTGATPWGGGDGNLIFLQTIDGGADGNKDAWSHHVLYIVGDGNGKMGGDVHVRINNGAAGTQETRQFSDIVAKASAIDGGYCMEIKLPWSVFGEKIPSFKPEVGAKLGMSMVPIDFDNGGDFAQLCWVNQAEKLGVARGYDYGGWATLALAAAPVSESPATADAASLALAALAASMAAGFAVLKARKH